MNKHHLLLANTLNSQHNDKLVICSIFENQILAFAFFYILSLSQLNFWKLDKVDIEYCVFRSHKTN